MHFEVYGAVASLRDQPFIHNGKKLINPLDLQTKPLCLGGDVACLEHLRIVQQAYPFDDHGVKPNDIKRKDHQHWASTQRLFQFKAQLCLQFFGFRRLPNMSEYFKLITI